MLRCLPTLCLAVELLLAPSVFAGTKEQCVANCEEMDKQFQKACKEKGQGGKCEGRGKAMVNDFKKMCLADCDERDAKKPGKAP